MPSADWQDHAACRNAVITALEAMAAWCDERALEQDWYDEGGRTAKREIELISEHIRDEIERLRGVAG